MTAIQSTVYVVYLLHFDQPVKRQLHYCGICKAERLHRRQLDHLSGHGAQLTRRAVAQGSGWQIVRLWQTDNRELERTLKQAGHFKRHCFVCTGDSQAEALDLDQVSYRPTTTASNWTAQNW